MLFIFSWYCAKARKPKSTALFKANLPFQLFATENYAEGRKQVHFGKKFKLCFSRLKYSLSRKQTCHSEYRRCTLSPEGKEITTNTVKILTGAGTGKRTLLKKQGKYIYDCAIHCYIPLKDFYFFRFEWKTTSKSQCGEKKNLFLLKYLCLNY